MNVISKAKSAPNHQVAVMSDLENLEASILKLTQMLERVTNYVDSVLVRAKNKTKQRILLLATGNLNHVLMPLLIH